VSDERMFSKKLLSLKSRIFATGRKLAPAKPTRLVSTILVMVIIALTLFVLVAPHFGFAFLTVMGGSMSPTITSGSLVLVAPVASSDIQVGDVIAYKAGGEHSLPVMHRVTDIINQDSSLNFQTAGDMNKYPDNNPVSSDSVIGKVRFHVPGAGFIFNFMKQPMGYGLVVGIPFMAMTVVMVRRLLKGIRSAKQADRQRVA